MDRKASPSSKPAAADEIGRLTAELAEARARIGQLELMAEVDPLLNILNRRGFERALAQALSYVRRYRTPAALLYLDLDGFKLINDAHGHAAGDAVLKAVAAILARNVRRSDVVGRLGGDEFGLLLFNLGEVQARVKARALESILPAAGVAWPGARLSVGASVGVGVITPHDKPATVIARADRLMYQRKEERRGGQPLPSDKAGPSDKSGPSGKAGMQKRAV
jgi:diguanylate cyclase (GGDEF)-like protein